MVVGAGGVSRLKRMPATVKKIVLWRTEVDNKPGALAATIEPPAKAGADLQIVMGYRHPGPEGKATIEVYPIAGKKLMAAAQAAGLSAAAIPALLVEGDNKPGLGYAIAQTVAGAGVNFAFFVAQVIGRKYSAIAGFENEDDAKKAVPLIKQALAPKRR
jgi:hypothetical protein